MIQPVTSDYTSPRYVELASTMDEILGLSSTIGLIAADMLKSIGLSRLAALKLKGGLLITAAGLGLYQLAVRSCHIDTPTAQSTGTQPGPIPTFIIRSVSCATIALSIFDIIEYTNATTSVVQGVTVSAGIGLTISYLATKSCQAVRQQLRIQENQDIKKIV